MYIGMNHLQELCTGFKHKFIRSEIRYGLTGWTTLRDAPSPYNVHLVYIAGENEVLSSYPLLPGMHLLLIVSDETDMDAFADSLPAGVNCLIIPAGNSHEILMKIQEFFDHTVATGLFACSLLEIMSFEGGIQEMVNHAFQIMENPIFVFDASFNLIAANYAEIEKHRIASDIIQNSGFSEFEFQLANRDHIHDKIKSRDMPLIMHHKELGYDQMIVAIDTARDLGHVVVSAVNRPFNEMDRQSLWILKKYIDQQMKKDEFVRNSKGFHYENFLKDLLDEKIAVGKTFMDRMKYVGVEFSGNLYCIVVEIARSSSIVDPYRIRSRFESVFLNCKTLNYNGQIIILLTLPGKQLMTEQQRKDAREICEQNGLYAGLSNCFADILRFPDYYRQSLRAIELGIASADRPALFVYENYYLEHMKNIFLQKESADTFCHPKMKFLLDYDKAHNSNLAYTLYMYLYHERNIGAAAEAMQMHRSSLTYRFKKIYSLIGEDLDDAKERLYLLLSYELNRPEA